jgi:hypothetical protein
MLIVGIDVCSVPRADIGRRVASALIRSIVAQDVAAIARLYK